MTRITRVEVIDENGRSYVNWEDDNDVSYMIQDSGRTLKVFVGKTPPEQPMTEEENERYFEEAKQIVENHFAKKKMTEKERIEGEIKILQKKLDFLEQLERTKSPVEEAYKRVYGVYPTNEITYNSMWGVFQKGYEQSQKDYKVGEFQEPAEELKTLYQMLNDEECRDDVCYVVKEWMSQYTHNDMCGEYASGYEDCMLVLEENLRND